MRSTFAAAKASRRPGFTLVELLVAMALILLIMVILAEAFTTGTEAMHQLKSIGDMQERLRTAGTILREDLSAYHFENNQPLSAIDERITFRPIDPGQPVLSQLTALNNQAATSGTPPPNEKTGAGNPNPQNPTTGGGFFRVWQGTFAFPNPTEQPDPNSPFVRPPTDGESSPFGSYLDGGLGQDGDGNLSYRAPEPETANHTPRAFPILHFTKLLPGINREKALAATVPSNSPLSQQGLPGAFQSPGTFISERCEVAYFLWPTGAYAGTSPLYALYRRQLAALRTLNYGVYNHPAPASNGVNSAVDSNTNQPLTDFSKYYEVSCKPNTASTPPTKIYFNSLLDLTLPQRRFGTDMVPTNAGMPAYGPASPYGASQPNFATPFWNYPRLGYGSDDDVVNLTFRKNEDGFLKTDDLLLNNVLSVDVKILWEPPDFAPLTNPPPPAQPNPTLAQVAATTFYPYLATDARGTFDFVDPPSPTSNLNSVFKQNNIRIFDTWSQYKDNAAIGGDTAYDYFTGTAWAIPNSDKTMPHRMRVLGLQISLRIYDVKTKLSRQLTIIQDM